MTDEVPKSETPSMPAREMMLRLQVPPDATQFDIMWYDANGKAFDVSKLQEVKDLEEAPPKDWKMRLDPEEQWLRYGAPYEKEINELRAKVDQLTTELAESAGWHFQIEGESRRLRAEVERLKLKLAGPYCPKCGSNKILHSCRYEQDECRDCGWGGNDLLEYPKEKERA